LDNTIIVVISDNGASGEGGPNGSVNENKFFNGYIDTVEESMRFYDHSRTRQLQPLSDRWAMAFKHRQTRLFKPTPRTRWYRRHGNHSWPNGIDAHGEVRDNYRQRLRRHADHLRATPASRRRTRSGVSRRAARRCEFQASADDSAADTARRTQFSTTMLGTRGICTTAGSPTPCTRRARPFGRISARRWELSTSKRPQPVPRLAAEQPEKLEELKALWFAEADNTTGFAL